MGPGCPGLGKTLATPRIYLTGSVAIEHGEQLIRERDFPGRQGRIAFVYLALHRHRTVHRDEMLTAIWPDDATIQGDSGLDPIMSKLRGVLRTGFHPAQAGIEVSAGTIALQIPDDDLGGHRGGGQCPGRSRRRASPERSHCRVGPGEYGGGDYAAAISRRMPRRRGSNHNAACCAPCSCGRCNVSSR